MKDGFVMKSGTATADEMEKINQYTRREYKSDEVYTFSLVLCDNEIDRDYERFSVSALEKLKELFLGRTCILDHERKSANQTARIYMTEIETERGRTTTAGEAYTRLTAKAYLPKTEKTAETITLIDSGILKEVSVGCAVAHSVCSICGKEGCTHRKGQSYGGKLCVRILDEPTDAYECSFVAVPAQREAGVRKSLHTTDNTATERLKQCVGESITLSADEAAQLRRKMQGLEEKAEWGEKYRSDVQKSILRLGAIAQPELSTEILKAIADELDTEKLSQLAKAFESIAAKKLPLRPQLAPEVTTERKKTNGEYRI